MKISSINKLASLMALIFASLSSYSFANEPVSPLNTIYACASIVKDTERLACFDKNVPVLKVKEEKKEIVAIDAKGIEAIERDSFGFSLPSLPKFGLSKSTKEKPDKTVQFFDVKSISKGRNGATITMANGHVWRQISGELGYIPKGNVSAKIKPAAVGTYFISLKNEKGQSGRKGARFKRIE